MNAPTKLRMTADKTGVLELDPPGMALRVESLFADGNRS